MRSTITSEISCDIITLQNILGHKTLAMTQRYAHLILDKHQKTREITQKFWQNPGDTVSGAVLYGGKVSHVSH